MLRALVAAAFVSCLGAGGLAFVGPEFSATGPDAAGYGAASGYPIGDRTNFFRPPYIVGSYSNMDRIFPMHAVARAEAPSALERPAVERAAMYWYQGERRPLSDYLARNPATGVLIARDDTILAEHYQYARNDRHRFASASMAKTITAMLVGIALDEGKIRSIDDLAEDYVPELKGRAYGATALRHLLTMSSGVAFSEYYDGSDDLGLFARDVSGADGPGGLAAVQRYNVRAARAGQRFAFASAEPEVLGLVLQRATGRSLAQYMSEKVWQPIGAEADAFWQVDTKGQEIGACCFNAVLRDYARFGLLLAHDGNWRGRQIIPRQWVIDATSVRPEDFHLKPGIATPALGYGYQVWILPGERRRFALLGAHGQAIFVEPETKLAVVHTAARPDQSDLHSDVMGLWLGAAEQFGE